MLDLNEIMTVCEEFEKQYGLFPSLKVSHEVQRDLITRARTWLPALVEELRDARDELAAVDESLDNFYAPVLDPETEEPCGSFWKDHGVNVMRQKLEQARAERDTLSALLPLYYAVDDCLFYTADTPYLEGHHNPSRLAALREVFLGMSADVPPAVDEEANANDRT